MPSEKTDKFRRLVEAQPDNELARFSLGSSLLQDDAYEEAEPQFARALELKDDWVVAYILRARCLIRLGRYAEARPLLDRGRELSIAQHHDAPVEEIDDLLEDLPDAAP